MFDVLCPSFASNLDDYTGSDIGKLYPDYRRQVMHLVEVRVVEAGEAMPGSVGDRTHVLSVCSSFSLARHPHHPQIGTLLLLPSPLPLALAAPDIVNVILQLPGHLRQLHDLNTNPHQHNRAHILDRHLPL